MLMVRRNQFCVLHAPWETAFWGGGPECNARMCHVQSLACLTSETPYITVRRPLPPLSIASFYRILISDCNSDAVNAQEVAFFFGHGSVQHAWAWQCPA